MRIIFIFIVCMIIKEQETNDNFMNESYVFNTTTNSLNQTQSGVENRHSLNDRSTLSFYFVTIVLTALGYAAVIPASFKKKHPSSVFIFSLAIADFFIGFVIVPIKITEVYGSTWQKDIIWCRIVNSVTIFGIALAGTNVVAVSLDRLCYFLFPLKYKTLITMKRALMICISCYLLSLPALLPAVGIGGQHTDQRLKFCAFKFSLTRAYMWAIGIGYFLVPSFVTILLQFKIMWLIRKYYKLHRRFIQSNPNQSRDIQMRASMKREVRVQKMFLAIIFFFFVCWGPFVVGIICNLVAIHLITPFFIQVMRIALFVNSFINPFIMFFSSHNIVTFLKKCFCRKGASYECEEKGESGITITSTIESYNNSVHSNDE